jgi:hypothetical protein
LRKRWFGPCFNVIACFCSPFERVLRSTSLDLLTPTIVWEYSEGNSWIRFPLFIETAIERMSAFEVCGERSPHYLFHPDSPAAEGKWIEMHDILETDYADISRSSHRILFKPMKMIDMFKGRGVTKMKGDRDVRRRELSMTQIRNDQTCIILAKIAS